MILFYFFTFKGADRERNLCDKMWENLNSSAVPWLDITVWGIKLEVIDTDCVVCVYVCSARYYQLSLRNYGFRSSVC